MGFELIPKWVSSFKVSHKLEPIDLRIEGFEVKHLIVFHFAEWIGN